MCGKVLAHYLAGGYYPGMCYQPEGPRLQGLRRPQKGCISEFCSTYVSHLPGLARWLKLLESDGHIVKGLCLSGQTRLALAKVTQRVEMQPPTVCKRVEYRFPWVFLAGTRVRPSPPRKRGGHAASAGLDSRPRFREGRLFAGLTRAGWPLTPRTLKVAPAQRLPGHFPPKRIHHPQTGTFCDSGSLCYNRGKLTEYRCIRTFARIAGPGYNRTGV